MAFFLALDVQAERRLAALFAVLLLSLALRSSSLLTIWSGILWFPSESIFTWLSRVWSSYCGIGGGGRERVSKRALVDIFPL